MHQRSMERTKEDGNIGYLRVGGSTNAASTAVVEGEEFRLELEDGECVYSPCSRFGRLSGVTVPNVSGCGNDATRARHGPSSRHLRFTTSTSLIL